MREDFLRRRVIGGAVDLELTGDLGAWRGAEQVLQRAAGNRIDAAVELADIGHLEATEQDHRVLQQLAFDQRAILARPFHQVHAGHGRTAHQRHAVAFEHRRKTHQPRRIGGQAFAGTTTHLGNGLGR
ncbi:hypothetical protein D3C78_1562100 [compost metagenome]